MKDADLPEGVTFELIPGGDEVAGQVTLDMCGVEFPSEALRVARHQRIARDSADELIINNENVRYRDADAAAQGLAELRAAIAQCDPDAFIESTVSGVPPLKYRIQEIAPDRLSSLSADRVAITADVTSQEGETVTYTLIYQRRGALLVGTFSGSADRVLPYAEKAALNLASLSADLAGE